MSATPDPVSVELRECPFCGGEAASCRTNVWRAGKQKRLAVCRDCGASATEDLWNERRTEAASQKRIGELEADKARLDYLDECNARLNAQYGTSYGWHLILNHNVNRLMLGHLEVDLCDNDGRKDRLTSCRAAIDQRMSETRAALALSLKDRGV